MPINTSHINKSTGGLLRNIKNLQHLFGANSSEAAQAGIEQDICCGLGRKLIYFSKGSGTPTTIQKYPFTFNNTVVWNRSEFEEALTVFYGAGYIAYVISSGNAVVLSAPYKKTSEGELDIADYVVIS